MWLYGSMSPCQVKLYLLPVALVSREGQIPKHPASVQLFSRYQRMHIGTRLLFSPGRMVGRVVATGTLAFDTVWSLLQYNVSQRLKFQE